MAGALEGIRILDLTTVLMGPSAAQMLGDMGADVIKVESLEGDTTRGNGVALHPGMASWFLSLNRNKRSLAMDLKKPEGRDALLRLARNADVLLYNIRPAAMKRLGLDYEDVAAVNPRIVYVGALGFGRGGPLSDLPAYDDLIQAATGLPWLFHYAGASEPRYVPTPIVDRLMSAHVAMNVLGGLQARQRLGRGQRIDVPMYETMASVMLGDQLGGLVFDPPAGVWGYRRMLGPERKPYRTKDGFVAALPYTDREWRNFFSAIDRLELYAGDARFTDANRQANVNELYALVATLMVERTSTEWLELFRRLDIAAMPLNSIEDLIASPQLNAVGLIENFEHPTEGNLRQVNPPAKWSETQPAIQRLAPNHGEHTREILREAGYSEQEIDDFAARGAVKEWQAAAPIEAAA